MKGLIIAGTIIIVLIILSALVMCLRRQNAKEKAAEKGWALKGDLSKTQERDLMQQLDNAAAIFRELGNTQNDAWDLAGMELISEPHKQAIATWLKAYVNRTGKSAR